MTATSKTLVDVTFVTRAEFEAFERNVDNNFSEIRDSQNIIGRKIDALATKGVDFKGIFAGVSVLLTILLAVGGLFGWGLNDKIDSSRVYNNAHTAHAKELAELRDQIIVEKLKSLEFRVTELKSTMK